MISISRIVIYTKKMQEMVDFYSNFLGYEAFENVNDRIVELRPKSSGLILLLHPASKGQKMGQSIVKLLFDVKDVELLRSELGALGIDIGPIHQADGYEFANFKDPSNNSVSISSRAYARK